MKNIIETQVIAEKKKLRDILRKKVAYGFLGNDCSKKVNAALPAK
jgi:hypothetical protein